MQTQFKKLLIKKRALLVKMRRKKLRIIVNKSTKKLRNTVKKVPLLIQSSNLIVTIFVIPRTTKPIIGKFALTNAFSIKAQ